MDNEKKIKTRLLQCVPLWLGVCVAVLLVAAVLAYAPVWQPRYRVVSSSAFFEGRDDVVNINEASAEELQVLPGIGPQRAEDIVAYREENGAFESVDELVNVPGIGPKTLEELREHVCV
jgi:competence protein ComEA